ALTYREVFENRKQAFMDEQKTYTWLSWDIADAYEKNELRAETAPVAAMH
ncbi:MAG: hypothetical protein H7211_14365, partial [Aquabacterium sp.]|nr:hypothetical protein [Ferruginibacter sp.]